MSNASKNLVAVFGKRMKTERRSCGYTLQEFADITGTTKSNIWALENGQEPRLVMALRIAQALDVSLLWLMDE